MKEPEKPEQIDESRLASEIVRDVRLLDAFAYADDQVIPPAQQEFFAVLEKDGRRFLAVHTSQWMRPLHLEAERRVRERYARGQIASFRVTNEVLRALHARTVRRQAALMDRSAIENLAWNLIEDAIDKGASDIHIETRDDFAQVFFRIHGERVEQEPLSRETAFELCSVLYTVHADVNAKGVQWSIDKVLDTSIEYTSRRGKNVQLRFSSGPIAPAGNFHMVSRLLVMDAEHIVPLDEIGYAPNHLPYIEDMLLGSQGMVLLVGPTNSGKSTSMQTFIQHIRQQRGQTIKIVTVEDPVEYVIPGACQMSVPHERETMKSARGGSVFHTFLRGILRQDPDVVMIGEIRDEESAGTVKDLVLTGRKVISTLHVYEAMGVFARLREIGIPESILFMQNFIAGVIYQRLVPRLCPHCSLPLDDAVKEGIIGGPILDRIMRLTDLGGADIRVRSLMGCPSCNHMGISGRTVCAEVLVPDEYLLDLLRKHSYQEARRYWLENPGLNVEGLGVSVMGHAISKMLKGEVDPRSIESNIGILHR